MRTVYQRKLSAVYRIVSRRNGGHRLLPLNVHHYDIQKYQTSSITLQYLCFTIPKFGYGCFMVMVLVVHQKLSGQILQLSKNELLATQAR